MKSEHSLVKPEVQTRVCLETDAPISCAGGADSFASRKKQSGGETLHMKHIMGYLAMILIFSSCEPTSFSPSEDDRFVVQAYLYAGEAVTNIRITSTLPLGTEESAASPINDAEVALIKNGVRYALVLSPGNTGYYHYPGDDLVIETGDVYDLEATVDGIMATARTMVPPPPDDVKLSATSIPVSGFWPIEPVIVQWPNPQGNWYFITHFNIEPEPQQIFDGTVILRPGLEVSEPTNEDFIEIPTYRMRFYGMYEVKVHRVNQEYVDLYLSREQDTRDLNEPSTNINNGLGIFTAFSSSTAFFEVIQRFQS